MPTKQADGAARFQPKSASRRDLVESAVARYLDSTPGTIIQHNAKGEPTGLVKGFDCDTYAITREGSISPPEATELSDTVRYVMTTDAVDRANDVVLPGGVNIRNFSRNAPALWSHMHGVPNVGKWVNLQAGPSAFGEYNGIAGDLLFHRENELSRELNAMAARGFLNACSIGFIPLAWREESTEEYEDQNKGAETYDFTDTVRIYTKVELLECSPCNVPMNPTALVQHDQSIRRAVEAGVIGADAQIIGVMGENRINAGLDNSETIPTPPNPTDMEINEKDVETTLDVTEEVSPDVVESDTVETDTPDVEEKTIEDLTEEKAGAPLNKRNRTDIKNACELLQGVLDRSKKEEEEEKAVETDTVTDQVTDQDTDQVTPTLEVDGVDITKSIEDLQAEVKELRDLLAKGAVEESFEDEDEEDKDDTDEGDELLSVLRDLL